jgi:hypothetical protein
VQVDLGQHHPRQTEHQVVTVHLEHLKSVVAVTETAGGSPLHKLLVLDEVVQITYPADQVVVVVHVARGITTQSLAGLQERLRVLSYFKEIHSRAVRARLVGMHGQAMSLAEVMAEQ